MSRYFTIAWQDGAVRMIDQRLLPDEVKYNDYTDARGVAEAIRTMVIRGAPAIGVAAAYGLAATALHSRADDAAGLRAELVEAAKVLAASRPTAVNLTWALKRMDRCLSNPALDSAEAIRKAALDEARRIDDENAEMNRQMGLHALSVVPQNAKIIHHCNTGMLATGGDRGTALGVIQTAFEHGRQVHVYVDETRPRLQGARLTAWELEQLGIPHTVIVDGASGHLMRTIGIDVCFVGCDRVAANGDTANKIGTFNLALAAHAHGVPFYVVGPTSTIDLNTPTGDDIPIEERPADEVTTVGKNRVTPVGAAVFNPAFDVTPARYITGIITEQGIATPPYEQSLKAIKEAAERMQQSGG